MTLAYLKIGNAKKSVSVGETCIKFFYTNTGCHIWKVEGLIALKRMDEARTSLDKAEKLIRHLIQTQRREISHARSNGDIELINAKLEELNAQKEQAEAIRLYDFEK